MEDIILIIINWIWQKLKIRIWIWICIKDKKLLKSKMLKKNSTFKNYTILFRESFDQQLKKLFLDINY